MTFVVAIDGPAGTGKSSVARMVAQKLNFIYVDTGAIYRALAKLSAMYKVDPFAVDALVDLINHFEIKIDEKAWCTRVYIDGSEVNHELRTEKISKLSSVISQHPEVRTRLLSVQRNLAASIPNGAIFEGRDIGTVVFPKAPLKIFITANSITRARRRFEEIQKTNQQTSFDEILESIEKRDERDTTRATAPMQAADDAKVIDTSEMSIDEVCNTTLDYISDAQKKARKGTKLW